MLYCYPYFETYFPALATTLNPTFLGGPEPHFDVFQFSAENFWGWSSSRSCTNVAHLWPGLLCVRFALRFLPHEMKRITRPRGGRGKCKCFGVGAKHWNCLQRGPSIVVDPAEWPKIGSLNQVWGECRLFLGNSKTHSPLNFLQSGPRRFTKPNLWDQPQSEEF